MISWNKNDTLALLFILLTLFLARTDAVARDITFFWTASLDQVEGYKLYYDTDASGTPYEGSGAVEGSSPVTIGGVETTFFTLHGLLDSATYYFTLTAYQGSEESDYATEIVLPPVDLPAGEVTGHFSWQPNSEPNLAGYKIHYGTTSETYTNTTDVGNPPPSGDNKIHDYIQNLVEGTTYFFVSTAYDTEGNESGYSSEVVWTATSQVDGTPPVADELSTSTTENEAVTGTVTGANNTGLPITFQLQQDVRFGTLLFNGDTGTYSYTPTSNYSGTDSFTFSAHDDNGASDPATVTITVVDVNWPPQANGVAVNVVEDTPLIGQLQASDPDGDSLTFSLGQGPGKGNVTVSGSGIFNYVPESNQFGADFFTFRVNDGSTDSSPATVSVTISSVNDLPTVNGDSVATTRNQAVSGQLQASDIDGDTLSYSIVSNGSLGSASITNNQAGTFSYTPNQNATGSDSFSFKVNDDTADSGIATISITIAHSNQTPVADAASFTTNEDTSLIGQLSGSDIDGDPLSYIAVNQPGNGSLILSSSGSFTYTPNQKATGNDVFTFKVNDGFDDSVTATVSISIQPVNDLPVAQDSVLMVQAGQGVNATLDGNDADDDQLTYIIVSDPLQAVELVDIRTGAYVFTALDSVDYPYSFTFRVNDGTGDSNTATVRVFLEDGVTTTKIFGDILGADYPGAITDTFTNLDDTVKAATEEVSIWSWSSTIPHKIANTVVIKADLSSLPGYAHIVEATLSLYLETAYGADTYSGSIHRITGHDPIIDQVTGFNAFNGNPWTALAPGTTEADVPMGLADIEPAEDTLLLGTEVGYRSWRITSMAQAWVSDATTNYGLLLHGQETDQETGRTFGSTEKQNGSIRPYLTVRYVLEPPGPEIISIQKN